MAFRNAVLRDLKQPGENGCPEYVHVGSNLLALSQIVRGGSLENASAALQENLVDYCVLLFATRNARGGKGEKELSYQMWWALYRQYPQIAIALVPLFVHYGYWKDLLLLLGRTTQWEEHPDVVQAILKPIREQWNKDVAALETLEGKDHVSVSLLAKWLPREKSSMNKKGNLKGFAGFLATELCGKDDNKEDWQSGAQKKYRCTLARLTEPMGLPEVLLAAQRDEEINFSRLASVATNRLRKVFLNENGKRDRSALAERFRVHVLKKGLKGGQLQPHEIVEQIIRKPNMSEGEKEVMDAQWNDLWKTVQAEIDAKKGEDLDLDPTRMIPMADVSGSMGGTPMHVSIALSIGLSEITHPAFRHMVMTFETKPSWVILKEKDSIVDKVRQLQRAPWGGSTNFEAAYDLILQVVEKTKLSREETPCLAVFSDMQFDEARGVGGYTYYGYSNSPKVNDKKTMFEVIQGKVANTAARLGWNNSDPTPIVFWNLRNSTYGHPAQANTPGTVLLSGFSPSLLKLVMTGGALEDTEMEVVQEDGTVKTEKVRVTPEEILRKMLDDEMYDPVRAALAELEEGSKKLKEDEGFELV